MAFRPNYLEKSQKHLDVFKKAHEGLKTVKTEIQKEIEENEKRLQELRFQASVVGSHTEELEKFFPGAGSSTDGRN